MKVLLVFLGYVPLTQITVNYAVYAEALQSLGVDVVTVCRPGLAEGFAFRCSVPEREDQLRNVSYWSRFNADAAIVLTWLRFGDELAAMRAAGIKTIALSDSDGYATPRSHPREWLRRMTVYQKPWNMKGRAALFWLKRYLRPRDDIANALYSIDQSDSIILHSPASISNLRRFTDRFAERKFESKMNVIPYPINRVFCEIEPSALPRKDRIISVGRWDDPQKDPNLLIRSLRRYADGGGQWEVVIVGREGERLFAPLTARYPQFKYLGVVSQLELRNLYLTSRSILFTSLWETGPIAAGEALASGCSLIGAPLMNFLTFHLVGPFGRCATARSSWALAHAIREETQCWQRNERSPTAIASYWRKRLNPVTVCQQLLSTVSLNRNEL